jgi:hypothetical protein
MHTYRQKGVVRVQVGILNRDQFPYTTDLVFGTKGYEITFAIEKNDFIPVDPPVEDHRSKEDYGNGTEGKSDAGNTQNKDKKPKNDSISSDKNSGSSSGPVPMQIALTPFPKGVDIKKILQYRRQRTKGVAAKISGSENLLSAVSSLAAEAKRSSTLAESHGDLGFAGLQQELLQGKSEQDSSMTDKLRSNQSTRLQAEEKRGQPALGQADGTKDGSRTELFQLDAISGTVQPTKQCFVNSILNGSKESAPRTSSPGSKSSISDLGMKEKSGAGQIVRSTATNSTGDEDMLEKSMKRTAWKNLDGPALQQPSPAQSYLLGYTLAPYMDYPAEAWRAGYGLSYLPAVGASTTGVFFPGSWVAV